MKIGKRYKKILPIYQYFAGEHNNLDFSEQAMLDMFLWETHGKGRLKISLFNKNVINGFAIGKHWMDVTIAMWNEDIKSGLLRKHELYDEYPDWDWWLNKVLN